MKGFVESSENVVKLADGIGPPVTVGRKLIGTITWQWIGDLNRATVDRVVSDVRA